MKTDFQKGEQYYTEEGDSVVFVCEDDGEYIVRPYYVPDEYDPYYGAPMAVSHLFAEPPTARRESRIVELDAKVKEVELKLMTRTDELAKLNYQIATIESKINRPTADIISKLSLIKGLEKIEDAIAGRFTHFVWVRDNNIEIMERNDYKITGGEKYLKLMTVYGNSKGDFQYRIQHYSMYREELQIWPFTNAEDARAKAIELLEESGRYLVGNRELYKAQQYLANAKSLNAEPSAAVTKFIAEQQEAARLYKIEQTKKELEKLEGVTK